MKGLQFIENKQPQAQKIKKQPSVVDFISLLRQSGKITFEEETILLDSSVRGNPEFV